MGVIKMNLSIVLPYKYLDLRCRDHIISILRETYINKLYERVIIKDFELDTDENDTICMTPLDRNKKLSIKVVVTDYVQYLVDDVVEGFVDLNSNPPLFRGEHLKMIIDNVTRQPDNIVTQDGVKLSHNQKCRAKIMRLDYIELTMFYRGLVSIITETDTPRL